MRINLKVYGRLRHSLGFESETKDVEIAKALTIGELLLKLGLSRGEVLVMQVNGSPVDETYRLQDGDELRLLPIVGGG